MYYTPQEVTEQLGYRTLEYLNHYGTFATESPLFEIPREFKNASLKNFKCTQQLIDFINDENAVFLWINGGVGSGKTYGAYALENYLRVGNLPVKLTYENRPRQRRSMFIEEYTMMDKFTESKTFFYGHSVLVLDDVGLITSGGAMNFLSDIYHNLVDYRRKNGLKTIFTSNLSPEGWFKALGANDQVKAARISSRLSGCTMQIKLEGVDHRKVAI